MRDSTWIWKHGAARRLREGAPDPERPRRPFDDERVAMAPDKPGVYFLYRHSRVLFIGLAPKGSGIRRELVRRLADMSEATAFDCVACDDPLPLYRKCMVRYVEEHHRLPEQNHQALLHRPGRAAAGA